MLTDQNGIHEEIKEHMKCLQQFISESTACIFVWAQNFHLKNVD
jgi:hypothetical protein